MGLLEVSGPPLYTKGPALQLDNVCSCFIMLSFTSPKIEILTVAI